MTNWSWSILYKHVHAIKWVEVHWKVVDSIENHIGQKRTPWCSFVPKRSKIGQEMAELWLFSQWKVAWFYWESHGTKGDSCVHLCHKDRKSVKKWLSYGYSPAERLRDFIENHMGLLCCSWGRNVTTKFTKQGKIVAKLLQNYCRPRWGYVTLGRAKFRNEKVFKPTKKSTAKKASSHQKRNKAK